MTSVDLQVDPGLDTARPLESVRDFDPMLAPYRSANAWYSVWQLVSTLALFCVSWAAMYYCLSISYWATLALAPLTALLLVRLFIFQHDCGHRSYFRSKSANDAVGLSLGLLTFTPYDCWRRMHAMHHACSGDLDRRGKAGEIWTMTVDEYRAAGVFRRLQYRIYRHPFTLFGFGAFYHFVIHQRFAFQVPKTWKKEHRNVHCTNAGLILLVLLMSWLVGPLEFLMVELPVMFVAAGVGVWMFYVQHQYEDAYWSRSDHWSYVQAALAGSSHYRLPKILQWFTGNIGLHHIHHLDARIPNYRLQPCFDANPTLQNVPGFTLLDSGSCIQAKLWDETQQKMVGFKAAHTNAAKLTNSDLPRNIRVAF